MQNLGRGIRLLHKIDKLTSHACSFDQAVERDGYFLKSILTGALLDSLQSSIGIALNLLKLTTFNLGDLMQRRLPFLVAPGVKILREGQII